MWVEFYGGPPDPKDHRLFALSYEVFHSDEARQIGFPAALSARAQTLGGAVADELRRLALFEGDDGAESICH